MTVAVSALVLVVLLGIGGVRGGPAGDERADAGHFGAAIAGLVPGDACLTADDPMWYLVAGRSPRPPGTERQVADLFGERVLRATDGGTFRFDGIGEMLLSDPSQTALVGYLESCPYVVIGRRPRTTGRTVGGPPSRRATESSATGPPPGGRGSTS